VYAPNGTLPGVTSWSDLRGKTLAIFPGDGLQISCMCCLHWRFDQPSSQGRLNVNEDPKNQVICLRTVSLSIGLCPQLFCRLF
jgi:hypothetical protein